MRYYITSKTKIYTNTETRSHLKRSNMKRFSEQSDCEQSTSKRPREEEATGTSSNVASSRSRSWAFSTASAENIEIIGESFTIVVGPRESDGQAHGIVTSVGKKDDAKRGSQWRKQTVNQMLERKNIVATYLQPIKSKVAYGKYVWKSAMDQMPAAWLQWAEQSEESTTKRNLEDQKIAKLYALFEKKPSKNKWSACLQEKFGLGYPENKINRSYKNWPRTSNQRLQKLLSKLNQRKAKQMTGKRALKYIKQLLSRLNSKWHGIRLKEAELETLLLCAVIESRSDEIGLSPHFLMEGKAGAGKTTLAQILFPGTICSMLPNDRCIKTTTEATNLMKNKGNLHYR